MPAKIHERVTVLKPGPNLNECGSVVEVAPTGVWVVLEDGRDLQSGGQLQPNARVFFLHAEVGQG